MAIFGFLNDVMVSEALPVEHPRASDSQGFTPKHSAAVRIQEKHCGFPSRFVISVLNIPTDNVFGVLVLYY